MWSTARRVTGPGAGAAAGSWCSGRGAVRLGRSAVRPLPSALRGFSMVLLIRKDLLGQFDIALGSFGAKVVYEDRLAEAGCFGEADASGDDGLEDLGTKELAEVVSDLAGEIGAVV